MANLKRHGLYNQRRGQCVGVYNHITVAKVNDTTPALVATLPHSALVTSIRTLTTTAGAGSISIQLGGVTVSANRSVATVNGTIQALNNYYETGTDVTIIPGSTAPSGADMEVTVVVEYIQLDRTTGHYTD